MHVTAMRGDMIKVEEKSMGKKGKEVAKPRSQRV